MAEYRCWLTYIARSVDNQFGHLEDAQKKDEEELKHLRQQLELTDGWVKCLEDALKATKEKVEEVDKMQQELDALRLGETAWAEREKVLSGEVERLKVELDDFRMTAEREKNEALEEVAEENERGFARVRAGSSSNSGSVSRLGYFRGRFLQRYHRWSSRQRVIGLVACLCFVYSVVFTLLILFCLTCTPCCTIDFEMVYLTHEFNQIFVGTKCPVRYVSPVSKRTYTLDLFSCRQKEQAK